MRLLIENQAPSRFVPDDHPGLTVTPLPGRLLADHTPTVLVNLIDQDHGPREAARFRVKLEATRKIDALQWRVERAEERTRIGADGETTSDVLREREAIRRASNRAEQEIAALDEDREARVYQFEVLPSDYPANPILSRLQFMRRFTDDERRHIRAARESGEAGQDIQDWWELILVSANVNLHDADIQGGVQALEQEGLIGEGRAAEVLNSDSQ